LLPKLKYRNMEPPGGWVYRDLDTGMYLNSLRNIDDLIRRCKAHRQANDLPIPDDFGEKIEASIAYSVAPELAIGLPETRVLNQNMASLFEVNKKTNQYLLDWRLKCKMEMVKRDEAETRAAQCVGCKNNNRVICLTCKGIDQWVNGWTGRHTKQDKHLGVCSCDGIVLYATIHSALENKGEFPEQCWKNKK
jgi:hypothetical protein